MMTLFHLGPENSDWIFAAIQYRKHQPISGCDSYRIRRATQTELDEASISTSDYPAGATVHALVAFRSSSSPTGSKSIYFFSIDPEARVNLTKHHRIGADLLELLSKHNSPALINRRLFDGTPDPKWQRANYFRRIDVE